MSLDSEPERTGPAARRDTIRGILFDKDGSGTPGANDSKRMARPAEGGRMHRRKAGMAKSTGKNTGRRPKAASKPKPAPKPEAAPETPFPATPDTLHQRGDRLWIPLRQEWRDVAGKLEETVRQRFIRHLCDHYGYTLDQMAQERRTTHGHRSPRADVVIWESPKAKAANRTPVLVVECKAENVDVDIRDYYQGESYTRAAGGEFFIAHNARHTAVFRLIPGVPGEFVQINEIPKAADWGDARRIEEIRSKLRAFNRREFQDLLFRCHRAFEHVRARVAAAVQAEKDRARAEIEAQDLAAEEEESRIDAAFAALNRELRVTPRGGVCLSVA